jgi:cation:H+ antiporter
MFSAVATLLVGLLLLYFGAEWLVKGAAGLGHRLGIRPLAIGLTVVAYGTSMPELVVSGVAALQGRGAIAVANVIGSNIANLGLILGITALISPIAVEGTLIRREIPVLVASTLLLPLVLYDGTITRLDAILLLGGAALFTVAALRSGIDRETEQFAALIESDAEAAGAPHAAGKLMLSVIAAAGLGLLLGGGRLFIDGAADLALLLGMSERVVGLTVVAIGTSAPELAASIVAAVRGHASIALGNIIGSNIFNVLFVLGGAGAIRPLEHPLAGFRIELILLFAFTAFAVFLVRRARRINRLEGALMLAGYAAFMLVLAFGA